PASNPNPCIAEAVPRRRPRFFRVARSIQLPRGFSTIASESGVADLVTYDPVSFRCGTPVLGFPTKMKKGRYTLSPIADLFSAERSGG
ncbi:MAG: hypothetical protein M0Z39_01795, partial [Actinomycetota bacterium]|nr:hypothetical protein [Actinomycetota bacterium]